MVTTQTKASVTLFQINLLPHIYCTASVTLTNSYCNGNHTNFTKCVACHAEFYHIVCTIQASLTGHHRTHHHKAGAVFSMRHLKPTFSVFLLLRSETENATEKPQHVLFYLAKVITASDNVRFQPTCHISRNKNHPSPSVFLP